MSLSMNVYAKYQWQNMAQRMKTSGTVTVSKLNTLSDYRSVGRSAELHRLYQLRLGSDLGDDSGNAINGIKTRTKTPSLPAIFWL